MGTSQLYNGWIFACAHIIANLHILNMTNASRSQVINSKSICILSLRFALYKEGLRSWSFNRSGLTINIDRNKLFFPMNKNIDLQPLIVGSLVNK
jgi:hypothetical protein